MSTPRPTSKRQRVKNFFKTNLLVRSSGTGPHESASSDSAEQSHLSENLKISGRFAVLILPKLAGCIDENPAKMAFNILNVIMDVKKEINDNKDELQRILEETLLLLSTVLAKMETGSNSQSAVSQTIEEYKRLVNHQLERITALNSLLHSSAFTQIDYENYKTQLADISRRIREATIRFNTGMVGTTGIIVDELRDEKRDKKLREDLQPSGMADHRFNHKEKSALKREMCTEGTRVKILNGITEWANESSESSPPMYWLTGQAGAGKTTIAYTIAKVFGTGKHTVLGANFFCSRQLSETRSLDRIIPTLAYQLARICETYRAALHSVDTSDAVQFHTVQEQIEKLLFKPWMGRKQSYDQPIYLVIVDALDEIEDSGRSQFLEQLLTSLQTDNITGLKFLVTSRPDPEIVNLCKTLPPRAVCKLQDVPTDEAQEDIGIYLDIKLKHLSATPEFGKLKEQSAGLFIYAATVVKILTGRRLSNSEQLKRLGSILSSTSSDSGPIDQLYRQVLLEAFSDLDDDPELLSTRLSILHTFLCSHEPISASVAASLVGVDTEIADIVVESLHAVLYVQNDKVYSYHASFSDFIFSPARSNFCADAKDFRFSCDPAAQHSFLTHSCFRIMNSEETGLRFNMGDIKSSYLLDNEHSEELRENITKNISPALRYACMHWAHHISLSTPSKDCLTYDMITDFLQLRVLFWIEAMNLLGSSGECSYFLRNARHWVLKDSNLNLAKDLQAVADFATYFTSCPAAESTPHLYISSLATWQSASHPSQSWKEKFPYIPAYKYTGGIVAMPIMTKEVYDFVGVTAFSPDSKHVAAGTRGSAMVLDASTGREEHVLRVEDRMYVTQVKFSPDGTRFVMVAEIQKDYHMAYICDASTFKFLHKFKAHRAAVAIEGTEILTISEADSNGHRQFQVLDISAGTLLRMGQIMMAKSVDNYRLIGFSSVSMRCMIVLEESLEMWDISSECGSKKVTLNDCEVDGGRGELSVMSPGGKLVAMVTSQDRLEAGVFDASTGSRLFVLPHDRTVKVLEFSYDGTRIASVSEKGNLYIWDATTGLKLKVLQTDRSIGLFSVAFTRDGSHLSLSLDDIIQVWSLDDLAEVQCATKNHHISDDILPSLRGVGVSNNPTKIMSFNWNRVKVWDASTGTALMMATSVPLSMYSPRMSDNGETIVCRLPDESVKVLDATNGDEILHLKTEANMEIRSLAVSQSGKKFALAKCTDSGEGRVEIWNLEAGKEAVFVLSQSHHGSSLNFSDDERYIVATCNGNPIVICDIQTGNTHKIESDITKSDQLVSISGNEFAVCETLKREDARCEVWEIPSGKFQHTFKLPLWPRNHDGKEVRIRSFCFSSKDKKFVAACSDGHIRVWSAISNKTVADVMLVYCSPDLWSIALFRDNKLAVTGSKDGSVQVWDFDDDPGMPEKYSWALQKNGWITSSQNSNHRLMWASERLKVRQPRNISIISGPALQHGTVDFSETMLGEDWEKCYLPQNDIGKSK